MNIYSEARPWGEFHVLDEGDGFKVKRIVVNPEGRLSLQSHKQRAEHWVVTKGEATVTVGEEIKQHKPGEHIYIPLGEKHRLENVSQDKVEIVEVQCGDYLGEDDIVRYEDIYSRV